MDHRSLAVWTLRSLRNFLEAGELDRGAQAAGPVFSRSLVRNVKKNSLSAIHVCEVRSIVYVHTYGVLRTPYTTSRIAQTRVHYSGVAFVVSSY